PILARLFTEDFTPVEAPVLAASHMSSGGLLPIRERSPEGNGPAALLGDWRPTRTRGFLVDVVLPAAQPGFSGPLSISCDFPLCPVWLPALFDIVGGLRASVRCCENPMPTLEPVFSCDNLILMNADGPGFSGSLTSSVAGSAISEFHENCTSPGNSEPVMPIKHDRPIKDLWDRTLRLWRLTQAFMRGVALAMPLTVPMISLLPKINSQSLFSSGGSWSTAIQARATVDLADDFHAGFIGWSGKPGWESTWSLDGSGSAQPG